MKKNLFFFIVFLITSLKAQISSPSNSPAYFWNPISIIRNTNGTFGFSVTSSNNFMIISDVYPNGDSISWVSTYYFSESNNSWEPWCKFYGIYSPSYDNSFLYGYSSAIAKHNSISFVIGAPAKIGSHKSGYVELFFSEAFVPCSFKRGYQVINGYVPDEGFGKAVDLDDEARFLVVGAPNKQVNGHQNAGGIYIYRYDYTSFPDHWVLDTSFQETQNNMFFGTSVSLSGDGHTLAVGEPGDQNSFGRVKLYKLYKQPLAIL